MRYLAKWIKNLAPASLLLASCGGEFAEDEASSALRSELLAEPISTWYESGSRTVYANGESRGTLNVRLSYKRFGTTCKEETRVMNRVPDARMTASLCGAVHGIWKLITASTYGCVSVVTKNPINAYYYNFTSPIDTQLNYRVFYWDGTRELASSGWQPPPGNGCPKT